MSASRAALDSLGAARPESSRSPAEFAVLAADAFLSPEFQETRRLLIELCLTAARSPSLAELLFDWQREVADSWGPSVPAEAGSPEAVVKAYLVLLMGLTHIDAFSAIDVPPDEFEALVNRLIRSLLTGGRA